MDRLLAYDRNTGLSPVVDDNDPRRYYLKTRHRRELIAIGTEREALRRFAARARLAMGRPGGSATPPHWVA